MFFKQMSFEQHFYEQEKATGPPPMAFSSFGNEDAWMSVLFKIICANKEKRGENCTGGTDKRWFSIWHTDSVKASSSEKSSILEKHTAFLTDIPC